MSDLYRASGFSHEEINMLPRGAIIVSLSSHTDQCIPVIMVAALKTKNTDRQTDKEDRLSWNVDMEPYTENLGTACVMLRLRTKVWKE